MTWLDEVKERLKNATPGRWRTVSALFEGPDRVSGVQMGDAGGFSLHKDANPHHNAQLIAHAPTDLTKAIELIEVYEAALEALETAGRGYLATEALEQGRKIKERP